MIPKPYWDKVAELNKDIDKINAKIDKLDKDITKLLLQLKGKKRVKK